MFYYKNKSSTNKKIKFRSNLLLGINLAIYFGLGLEPMAFSILSQLVDTWGYRCAGQKFWAGNNFYPEFINDRLSHDLAAFPRPLQGPQKKKKKKEKLASKTLNVFKPKSHFAYQKYNNTKKV